MTFVYNEVYDEVTICYYMTHLYMIHIIWAHIATSAIQSIMIFYTKIEVNLKKVAPNNKIRSFKSLGWSSSFESIFEAFRKSLEKNGWKFKVENHGDDYQNKHHLLRWQI